MAYISSGGGSGKGINIPKFQINSRDTWGRRAYLFLDSSKSSTLTIESMTYNYGTVRQMTIYGDGNQIAQYNNNNSNISINVSNYNQIEIELYITIPDSQQQTNLILENIKLS